MNTDVVIPQSIINLVSDGIVIMNDTGTVTTINPSAVRMFGFSSADEIVGHNIKLLIPDLFPGSQNQSKEARMFGIGRKAVGRKKDDSVFQMMITITETYVLGRNKQFIGVMREIVERKRAVQADMDKLPELQAIIDHIPDSIWIKDLSARYLLVNRSFAENVGKIPQEIQGLNDFDLYSEKLAAQMESEDTQTITSGEQKVLEERVNQSGGEELFYSLQRIPIRNDKGQIVGLLGISREITNVKRLEELLLRLGRILDDTLYEVFIFEAKSMKFVHVNHSGCKNTGYDLEELNLLTPIELLIGFTSESFEMLIEPLLDETEDSIRFEATIQRKNGTLYPAEFKLQISRSENPPLFMAVVQDITARKEAEEALRKAERRLLYSNNFN